MKNIKIKKQMMMVFLPLFLLVGCVNDDDDASSVTDVQAKSAATQGIVNNINTTLGAAGGLADNATAVQTIIDGAGNSTQSRRLSIRSMGVGANGMDHQLESALDKLLSNGVRSGNTITYTPDANTLCEDELLGNLLELTDAESAMAMAECVDMFENVTLVLTIISEDEGTVAIKYNGFSMVVIGYAPNSIYFETDLAQLKSIAETEGSNDILPATFEGVTRLTFTELGVDYGQVTLSIEEAINIMGNTAGEEARIHVAATPKVLELTLNAPDKTASMEVALAAVQALFPIDAADNNSGSVQRAELDLKGLTLKADLEAGGDKLVFTNIGIGSGPFTFNVIDPAALEANDLVDLNLALDTFGFTVDGVSETILFDNAFSMVLDVNDVFAIFGDWISTDSRLSIDVAQNTELKPQGDVIKVSKGSVSGEGTGAFTGSATYTTSQCFTVGNDYEFLWVDAICP